MREQKSEGGPYRKQLDPCGERPTHTGKVSETEKLQGCQEGDCCHCTEVDHRIRVMLLQNAPYRTGGSMLQAA